MTNLIIFFVLNLINVILGTTRSILTVKAKPLTAVIINTVSYTFYSGIVKMISGYDLMVVVITTALTNIIGVYIAKLLVDKCKKDKLWLINVTCLKNDTFLITKHLQRNKIGFNVALNVDDTHNGVTIYSYTQAQSEITRKILQDYKVHYNVLESKTL